MDKKKMKIKKMKINYVDIYKYGQFDSFKSFNRYKLDLIIQRHIDKHCPLM